MKASKHVQWWLRFVACVQVSGGVWGIAGLDEMTEPLFKSPLRGTAQWWWTFGIEAVLMMALVGSVVGGVLLWKGKRSGVIISRVIQGLQVLQFQVGGLAYALTIGAAALITADGGGVVGLKAQYGDSIEASWTPDMVGFAGAFNVLAFAMLVILVAPADRVLTAVGKSPGEPAV